MARTGPRRPLVALKLGEEVIADIDARAGRDDRNRSEQIRLMLAYAQRHMPAGWRPEE